MNNDIAPLFFKYVPGDKLDKEETNRKRQEQFLKIVINTIFNNTLKGKNNGNDAKRKH